MSNELVKRMVAHAKENAAILDLFPRFCAVARTTTDGICVQLGGIKNMGELFPDAEFERSERETDEYPYQYSLDVDGVRFFCIESE